MKLKYFLCLESEATTLSDAESHIKITLEDFNNTIKICPFKCKIVVIEEELETNYGNVKNI